MNRLHRSERGQILILIVFGMIALLGATALAVDGGNAYSDRRHAQNAADTAGLATGLTLIRSTDINGDGIPTAANWVTAKAAGYARALDNGYPENSANSQVLILQCTEPGATCVLPAGEPYTDTNHDGKWETGESFTDTNHNGFYDANNPADFLQVKITSEVVMYFARVLGIPQVTNGVEAIVKAVPPIPTIWYNGSALVATMPGCKTGGWPNDPFTTTGNSVTLVTGAGGIFVNSTCDPALTVNNNTELSAVAGICVVGGVNDGGLLNPPATHDCTPVDTQLYQLPNVSEANTCSGTGTVITLSPGNYLAGPGIYTGSFPPNGLSAGTIRLARGVYCLKNGLSLSGTWNFTTDIDGNGTFDGSDGSDEGVMFYMLHGGVTFNGSSNVQIGAMNKVGTDPAYKGYLIYMPPTNHSTIKIAGGNGSTFIGTILAPGSLVTLEGGSSGDSLNLECQIIGYSVNLAGGGTLNISFSQGQVGKTFTNPILLPFR